jgi:hypothetical protein
MVRFSKLGSGGSMVRVLNWVPGEVWLGFLSWVPGEVWLGFPSWVSGEVWFGFLFGLWFFNGSSTPHKSVEPRIRGMSWNKCPLVASHDRQDMAKAVFYHLAATRGNPGKYA